MKMRVGGGSPVLVLVVAGTPTGMTQLDYDNRYFMVIVTDSKQLS